MAAIGRNVHLFGRVQGVFFRQWTVNQARSLGVSGWVHNARDGSVQAHIAGETEAVSELIKQMQRGPPQARVDDVTIEEVEPQDIRGFAVKL